MRPLPPASETLRWAQPPADWALAFSSPAASCPPDRFVHVWALPLAAGPAALASFAAVLAPPEAERAARFHFQQHRNRFLVGRGWLRILLAQYLRADPRQLAFVYGPNGKPALAGPFAESGLHFNLSHSQDLALLAVTRAGKVGIDVEWVRPLNDAESLVARFFSPRETAAFRALPLEQKPAAFFSLWTRKEAWLKATGEGIARSLHRVEVSFLPGEPARLLSLPPDLAGDAAWKLHDLAPAPGFAAALAVAAHGAQLRCWRGP